MKHTLLPSLLTLAACASGGSGAPPPASPGSVAPDIRGEEIDYAVGGVRLKGYLAYDAAKTEKRPGVLVVHEWWGHDDYARARARQLAEMGYTGLALDMYGDGKAAAHPADAQKFAGEVMSNLPVAAARFQAAQKILESHESTDGSRTAAIGYCFGGAVALHMARAGEPLRGVASFHGDLGTASLASPGSLKAKVFVAHGAADPFIPPETVAAFKAEMAAAGADLTFIAYEGAKHGFTNPAATARGQEFGLPLEYQKEADEQSWAALEAFLARTFE